MTDDVFQTVKDLVPIAEAVRLYGYEPSRSGFICCPFHNEKTASLKLYDNGSFYCFGCGAHGTVIDFAAKLFNLRPLDAVKRLNEDFRLGVNLDAPQDRDQLRQRRKTMEAKQRFSEWREQMLNQIDKAIRVANLADFRSMTEAEATAVRFRESLEAWASVLMHGSLDEQMQIFRDREGVGRLCQMILHNMQTKSTAA